MARPGSHAGKRVWKKIIVALVVAVIAIGSMVLWKRYAIAVWYMEGNKTIQETVILTMLENARPVIEKELKMTLPEKLLSSMAGKRSQKERQTDALKDVRAFGEMGFENHWLKFRDVHALDSLNGFPLHGFPFALEWNRGNGPEILTAFNIRLLKREVGKMQINQSCSYFTELRLFVEKKAKQN
ncbi:MAG: hypothetical protein ABSG19_03775 [Candidatus Aminicenantales bacterium]